jgi:hypothetical protein
VLFIVIGFPIALILAWAFELTPEGIKRAEDVDLSKSVAPKTSRKLTVIIIAIVVLALSLLVFQLTRPHPAMNVAKPPGVPNDNSVAVLRSPTSAAIRITPTSPLVFRTKSSLGWRIAELKVICAPQQRFKSAPDDLPAIAMGSVSQPSSRGSVQRTGDKRERQLIKNRKRCAPLGGHFRRSHGILRSRPKSPRQWLRHCRQSWVVLSSTRSQRADRNTEANKFY